MDARLLLRLDCARLARKSLLYEPYFIGIQNCYNCPNILYNIDSYYLFVLFKLPFYFGFWFYLVCGHEKNISLKGQFFRILKP